MRPRTFWHVWWNTLTSPSYYRQIMRAPLWLSVRFFLMSYVLISLISTLILGVFTRPLFLGRMNEQLDQFGRDYPANVALIWTGSELQSTTDLHNSPLVFEYPSGISQTYPTDHLVTVDPSLTLDTIHESATAEASLMVIGKTELLVTQFGDVWSGFPLKEIWTDQAFTVNQASLPGMLQKIKDGVLEISKVVLVVYPALFFILSLLARLPGIFIDAFLITVLLRLAQRKVNFGKVFQLALHLSVVAHFVAVLTQATQTTLPMYQITFWIYLLIVAQALWMSSQPTAKSKV